MAACENTCMCACRAYCGDSPVRRAHLPRRPTHPLVQAAAARAAAQAAHGVRTQFFDHAADVGPFDPLALVLSYGEEEEEDEEQDGERGHARAGASSERNLLTAISGHEHGSPDPLAGFLSELQSEGLLDAEDEAAAAALVAPDPQPELLVGACSHHGGSLTVVPPACHARACALAASALTQQAQNPRHNSHRRVVAHENTHGSDSSQSEA